ncbi:carboxymuconolactone decarboxylase family protein [Ottowia thiooxydans]|uniref:4-carboxymuconolactone decarboxylase n=1 Tax=Ottowia thiooxydans TaxID=219182 RepID=A0ABV2QHD4_9BURK
MKLTETPASAAVPYDAKAVEVRRHLLGDDVFEAMQRDMTALDAEWQAYTTNQLFGRTWARGILSHQQLSLINLAMLAGLGRMEEFELHLRIAVTRTQVPLVQLREVILHIGMYCGIPIARECFVIARRLLAELNVDLSGIDELA